MKLLHEELTDKVIGCCIAVHKALGPGFLEKIYEEALCMELAKAGLKFERQKVIKVYYDGKEVGEHRLDLFVEDILVLELEIDPAHLATTNPICVPLRANLLWSSILPGQRSKSGV